MKKLGNILVMSLAVLVVAFIVFRIFFNLVENLRCLSLKYSHSCSDTE